MSKDKSLYWKKNISLILWLLVIWFLVSFAAGIMFVDQLDQIQLFGYPLGFWFAEQGSIYVFILLIVIYTMRMNKIDRDFGVRED